MATLAELRTGVALRLQDPNFTGISSASVDAFINTAIKYYKHRVYWFNQSVANIALTVNDSIVPNIPSDFLVELPDGGLTISYSNMFYPLAKVPSNIFDQNNYRGQGIPYIYTYRNQAFEVYYKPSIAYTLVFRYLKDYVPLVADGSSNDFTNHADQMIIYNALSRIYAEIKQDPNMETYYTARAADEEDYLLRRSDALTGTGTLTLHSNLYM